MDKRNSVYDVVPTIAFGDQKLALPFRKTNDPTILALDRFDDAAGFPKLSPTVLRNEVKSTIDKAFECWPATLREMMPRGAAEAIVDRINLLPFVNGHKVAERRTITLVSLAMILTAGAPAVNVF